MSHPILRLFEDKMAMRSDPPADSNVIDALDQLIEALDTVITLSDSIIAAAETPDRWLAPKRILH
jgi:sulfur transfer complex TusBCD TusB component (DsrH family)